MEHLAEILSRSLKKMPGKQRLEDYTIWTVWEETVGTTIARNARPHALRGSTLVIKVASSTWMQQLQYMKDILASKLNSRLGREVIEKMYFTVGTITANVEEPIEDRPAIEIASSKLPTQELDSIKDPALRTVLLKLITTHLRNRTGK